MIDEIMCVLKQIERKEYAKFMSSLNVLHS